MNNEETQREEQSENIVNSSDSTNDEISANSLQEENEVTGVLETPEALTNELELPFMEPEQESPIPLEVPLEEEPNVPQPVPSDEKAEGNNLSDVESSEEIEQNLIDSQPEFASAVEAEEEKQVESIVEVSSPEIVSEENSSTQEEDAEEEHHNHDAELEEHIAYDELSREELTEKLRACVALASVPDSRNKVTRLREAYRNVKNEEIRHKKENYLENGGIEEDFEVPFDSIDEEFKALQERFREARSKIREQREKELHTNLRIREGLIEELKKLVEEPGSNNKELFEKLKGIDSNWRAVGRVPQLQMDEVYKTYQFHRERLFELVHINDELRDLDYRKNLELKTELCEKAEALFLNDSIKESIDAYNLLLKEWKDIGHVTKEQSDAVWDRFKAAGDRLFDRRKEYLESKESEYSENLAKKLEIIEKTKEQISKLPLDNHTSWQEISEVFNSLMADWKKAGFAAPKDNQRIWEEFKAMRDHFYAQKEVFYKDLRQAQNDNYKVKVDLCMQAEALKESADWKATADQLKVLQDKWKSSGPVARKHSDKLWKRFRTACDDFFNRRKEHFADMTADQDENLKKKEDLVERIQAYVHAEDGNETFETLKAFQNEWMSIGLVPIKQKEKIQKNYRTAIDAQFAKLKNLSAESRREAFRSQVQNTSGEKGGKDKLQFQRNVVQDKIRRLESDVQTLENNIGFFANSKSKAADDMRRDIQKKISKTKEEIGQLRDQLRILRSEA